MPTQRTAGKKRKPSSKGRDSSRKSYESKRDLSATPEPSWKTRKSQKSGPGRSYVIQKHAARRLHYDLRLEIEGALASWAVPKGLPLKPGEKNLAIKVEDHPLDYGQFEGNIPVGNYGAGAVMLWDRGLYELLEKNPAEAVRKGRLSLVLAGEKVRGHWILVRTGSKDEKEQWLILKGEETDLRISPEEDDCSVASGRTLAQIAEDQPTPGRTQKGGQGGRTAKTKVATRAAIKDLPRQKPSFVAPMKPHLSAHLPKHGDWIYEIKFDGYRVLAVKDGAETILFSRNRKDVSRDFPDIRDAVGALPVNQLVLDGEIVALLESGLSSFQLLQNRGRADSSNRPPIYCYAFDLLNLEGRDTTQLPLNGRKELLRELLSNEGDPLRFSASINTDPESFLAQAKDLGLEGLIAKEVESNYQPGRRSRSWLKIKLHNQQEFVIGGYTLPKGSRSRFGSVIVGVYEGGKLHYTARVGTGFDERSLEKAYQMFQPLCIEKCPFVNLPSPRKSSFGGGLTAADMKRCVWLEPKLVCQVKFSEWTSDGGLRHPVFLGFRDDKSPREVKREEALQ